MIILWNEVTILWNEVTIWWNEVTKGWNEVAWNEMVMELLSQLYFYLIKAVVRGLVRARLTLVACVQPLLAPNANYGVRRSSFTMLQQLDSLHVNLII